MQEMTSALCSNTTTPLASATSSIAYHSTNNSKVPEVTLRDTRDESTYVIRKLADGNCWMTQNLHLGSSSTSIYMTSVDTDITSPFTLPTSNCAGKWTNYNTTPSSAADIAGYCKNSNETGDLYNYYAATAGTVGYNLRTGNASGSICPKGWRLPISDGTSNTKTFQYLFSVYSSNVDKMLNFPFNAQPNDGYYHPGDNNGNSPGVHYNSHGYYWSSTIEGAGSSSWVGAWILRTNTQFQPHLNDGWRSYGYVMRCVAK